MIKSLYNWLLRTKLSNVFTPGKIATINYLNRHELEKRVQKALEAVAGVTGVEVSHEKGTAIVSMDTEVSSDVLTQAVTAQDYEVVSVEE